VRSGQHQRFVQRINSLKFADQLRIEDAEGTLLVVCWNMGL